MDKSDLAWLWFSAVVLMLFGFGLVRNGYDTGWFPVILGVIYIIATIKPVHQWIARFSQ